MEQLSSLTRQLDFVVRCVTYCIWKVQKSIECGMKVSLHKSLGVEIPRPFPDLVLKRRDALVIQSNNQSVVRRTDRSSCMACIASVRVVLRWTHVKRHVCVLHVSMCHFRDAPAANGDARRIMTTRQGVCAVMDDKRLAVSRKVEDPESPAVVRRRVPEMYLLARVQRS